MTERFDLVSDCIATENTAAEIIGLLDLKPHPEGNQYRGTIRDTTTYKTQSLYLEV